jgi:type II secretory pathway pseudopilin PulG
VNFRPTGSTPHRSGPIKRVMDGGRPTAHARPHEAGFALIEVIVSAAVLAIIALSVLGGIDAATSSTGREKARSVAAVLAEKDQERLRSLQFDQLAAIQKTPPPPQNVTVDGVQYTISSQAQWINDGTGVKVTCTSDPLAGSQIGKNGDYLQISSIVTSAVVGTRVPAVRVDSIAAPSVAYSSTHGSIGVKVSDANGQPVQSIAVTLTKPDGTTDAKQTNSDGCALWQGVDAGSYGASLNTSGWVDHFGNTPVSATGQQVAAGRLTLVNFDYDKAAQVTATIKSYSPGSATSVSSAAKRISAVNSGELALLRNYPLAGPAATAFSTLTADALFPFPTAYSFFTGTCGYENPAFASYTAAANVNYFKNNPGQTVVATSTAPGAVTIYQPGLNVRVTQNSAGKTVDNSTNKLTAVVAYPQLPSGQSCVAPPITDLKSLGLPATSPTTWGYVGRANVSGSDYDAGVPIGTYKLCFSDGSKHFIYPDNVTGATGLYDNTVPGGQATQLTLPKATTPKLTPAWQNGSACPATA